MKYLQYLSLSLIVLLSVCCGSSKQSLSKIYKKRPYSIMYIFDNKVNDTILSRLLKLNVIEDAKVSGVQIVRLNDDNTSIKIKPALFSLGSLSESYYIENVFEFDACKKIKQLIVDDNYSLFVYSKNANQTCSNSQSYNNIESLNDAISDKIYSDANEKETSHIVIYVPTPEDKPECDVIDNCELQFSLNKTLFSVDDNDPNLHYIYPVTNGSSVGYYYLICNEVCSAKSFKVEMTTSIMPQNYQHIFTIEELSTEYNYPNTYVFRIPQGTVTEETIFNFKITPLNYDKRIKRTKAMQRTEKIVFKHCTN